MTRVREIIETLQQFDADAIVLVQNDRNFERRSPAGALEVEHATVDAKSVQVVTIWSNGDSDWKLKP